MARRKLGFWYRLAVLILKPWVVPMTRRDWRGVENLPAEGGFLIAVNHVSHLDPITTAHFLHNNGKPPRYLGKAALFKTPFIGRILRGAGQIPVYRESAGAADAFRDAVDAVHRGECVVFYPEGTITRDPDLWPMVGKSGVARVALLTGAPVIPVAQWGAQEILAPYAKTVHVAPRKTIRVVAGPPVDLSAFQGKDVTPAVLREATAAIMADVTRLLEEIRGEKAPAERFDPRSRGVPTIGNPNVQQPHQQAPASGVPATRPGDHGTESGRRQA